MRIVLDTSVVVAGLRTRLAATNGLLREETAINGRADAVVTYNLADFAVAAKRFKISALSPRDLLKKVRT